MEYIDKQDEAVDLLCQGFKPSHIARQLNLTQRQTYHLLAHKTATYIPADNTNDVWRAARSTVVHLLTSLGITGKEIARLYGIHPSQITRLGKAAMGASPTIKVEIISSITVTPDEHINAGVYTLHRAGKSDTVCLVSVEDHRLYFVSPNALCGRVKVVSISGVSHNEHN